MRPFFISFFLLAMALPAPASAQLHSGYCDTAKSTAETLDCINRHKNTAQGTLQEAYEDLSKQQNDKRRQVLARAQTNWLSYRDAECAWEAQQAEAPALERIYELSCIARLTGARATALTALLQQGESRKPPEFSATPRWLNVLTHDYPDIFWRHGSGVGTDLDCDGERDQILPGLRVTIPPPPEESGTPEKARASVSAVIAIARNPVTGRPKARLFELPLRAAVEMKDLPHLCSADIGLALTARPIQKPPVQDNTAQAGSPAAGAKAKAGPPPARQCRTMLQITGGECPPVFIYWNGSDYVLQQAGKQ